MAKSIHVRVPGTSANCGPGFDCLGLACSIYNDLTLTLTHEPGLRIDIAGDGARIIPTMSATSSGALCATCWIRRAIRSGRAAIWRW